MVYLVGDLENAKAFMLMKYGTKGFYDRSYNLIANKHLAPCYPLDGRNLYKVVKLDEDFLNDLVILLVPFTHIADLTEEHRSKLNNILKSYKDWQNLDPYQARLVVDRLLSSKDVKSNNDLKELQKTVSGYSSANGYDYILATMREKGKESEDTSYPRMKPISTGSNPTKPKPKKVDFVKRCDYNELVNLVSNSSNYKKITSVDGTYFSDFDGSPRKLSDFLTTYFGSEYWNLPVSGYKIEYNGKFFAGHVSINVTGLSTSVLANGYHSMREDWSFVDYRKLEQKLKDCYYLYKGSNHSYKDAIPIKYVPLTLLDFTNRLVYKDRGIFLEMGLVRVNGGEMSFANLPSQESNFTFYGSPIGLSGVNKRKLRKTATRYAIQEWRSTHQKVVERAKYCESEWLHRDLSEIVTPKPNTKIIYVCYLPETGVIKVGRTRNWGSRKGVYSRFKGDSKLTSGIMRLCYYWNVTSTGDEVVDRFLMYCAEDHLKLLANHRMRVVEGKEFFKGYDLNEFIREVRSYFESLSVSRLISIRDTSKIKRFCSGESYDYDRLMQKLQDLKEKN